MVALSTQVPVADIDAGMGGNHLRKGGPSVPKTREDVPGSPKRLPGGSTEVWLLEVGMRAGLRTESRPRDTRWWKTIWRT